ncbi:protein-glutamate O-methyltransferase CheR [Sphingomonas sp. BIUV-7]|uniref:Protein-glutamate O-methyltransferase CheR n=1 Tax=Sphingomonas natans TaxID=3063330 RepID=A0ABT8Y6E6_9SPHN|nr:protein-glutamate O-methyltransferase CheR [Sphingomonas sp. BIUV-7]MDO6413250.1 protein-glutamate O-methyltransferase CheR [Sphingomonas sp. BIUV-7]
MDMSPLAAGAFSKLLERATGQELLAARRWRIETALGPVLKAEGLDSLDQLATRLGRAEEGRLIQDVVEALLNHETSFFRDIAAFRSFADEALPAIAERRIDTRRLRIWSAGCSTGQEAYSLAIQLHRATERWQDWDVSILATDVSPQAISRAREGLYGQLEIQRGLPIGDMLGWFEPEAESWRAKMELRRTIAFAVHNLMEAAPAGRFDIVLCRNVLLYFPIATRRSVLDRIAQSMAPDGLLFLGAGETVLGQSDAFEADRELRGFYRLKGWQAAQD